MKKLAQIVYKIILGVCVAVMAVFYTLASVVMTPFRASEYRKSAFGRESGAAYQAGVTETLVYRLYNRLRANGVAMELIAHPKESASAHLLWQDAVIIHEIDRVKLADGRWVIGSGSPVWKEGLDLKDAVAEVLEDVVDDRPGFRPGNALLLVDRREIPEQDRLEAEAMPMFLLYDDEEDLYEVLRKFCQ